MSKQLCMGIGDVMSVSIGGHTLRREVSRIDGVDFFRFTMNPGLSSEFQTFWSTDEGLVKGVVLRKCVKRKA